MQDPWKSIRKSVCFGNEELDIKLIAITTPIGNYDPEDAKGNIECIPAVAAGTSYNKEANTIEAAKALNKKLIKMGHLVPLESLQYNFLVTGLSKAAGAQWSRHRSQAHVSLSRRYTQQQPKFVYPSLSYIKNKDEAEATYQLMSGACENAYRAYKFLIDTGAKKQDARLIMPVNVSTTRNAWANARALRDFFRLRLDSAAEEEIRKAAYMLLDIVYVTTPSIFEDIVVKFKK
jgi:thymidylate synthase (FAD)